MGRSFMSKLEAISVRWQQRRDEDNAISLGDARTSAQDLAG
jgi:hypothetical protein